jgi:hypothetical protein
MNILPIRAMLLSLLVLLVFVGCKKDKEVITETDYRIPRIVDSPKLAEIPPKLAKSTKSYANLAVSIIEGTTDFFDSSQVIFLPPAYAVKTVSASGTTFIWTDSTGRTENLLYSLNQQYTWDIYFQSSQFPKYKVLEVREATDHLSGSAVLYANPAVRNEISKETYSWSIDANGNVSITIGIYDNSDAVFFTSISKFNTDQTGSYKQYDGIVNNILAVDISWDSNGSGIMLIRDEDSGTMLSCPWTE